MPKSTNALVSVAAASLVLAACSTGGNQTADTASAGSATSDTASTSAQPTLTASSLQPPSQDNDYTKSSGRPKVVFDPCTWIPDDAISKIGYDPSTRKRGFDVVAEHTFLTCQVTNADGALQLISGNITLDEDKQKYAGQTQNVTINGRDAVIIQKTNADECDLDMKTKVGYFEVAVIIGNSGQLKGLKPCDHIVDTATSLEPYIGKDN